MKTLLTSLFVMAAVGAVLAQPATPFQPPGTPPPGATVSQNPVATAAADDAAAAANAAEEIIPKGTIKFPGTDIDQVLQIYAELVNRTILRPATLPAGTITLETQTDLTKEEAIQALDAVLAMNGISMVNIGEKFVKAVPMAEAGAAGGEVSKTAAEDLPNLGQYLTHIVQLKYVKAADVMPALQPFSKIPNSVLAIEGSNMLILRDYTENVKRMLEMIARVDIPGPSDYVEEVIPIKYALATDIADALNSLSSGGGTTSVGTRRTSSGNSGSSRRSGAYSRNTRSMPGMMNNQYSPQAISTTAPTRSGPSGSTFTDRLRNIINKASGSGELEILGETRIIADERTNSLLIFASKQDMKMIKDVISKLDVVLAQVLIEALVIEVALDDSFDYGVSYLSTGKQSGKWTSGGGAFNDVSFINPKDITTSTSNLLGGFSYYANYNDDLLVAVSAAATDNKVSVLQRPRIQTSHAVPAELFVGETRPYPTGSSYGGVYGGYSSIQQLNIGVTLSVTPLINPDGLVVMDIDQTVDSFGGNVTIQNVGDVPRTLSRHANAVVAVHSGDTIVLGGFISADSSLGHGGVPFLKDIPGLGLLFKSQSETKSRRELMIFIRPTVLDTPQIAAKVAMDEKNKMPGVVAAERELTKEYKKEMKKLQEEQQEEQQTNWQPVPGPSNSEMPETE